MKNINQYKKIIKFSLLVCLTFILVIGLSHSAFAAAKYKWRVAVTTPPTHPYNAGLEKFKELLANGSNGQIEVTIFPSGQLGGETESAKNVQLGTLEMTIASTSNISPLCQELQALTVPYLFKDMQCAYKTLDGEIGQFLVDKLLKNANLRVLGWYTFGMRHILNTKRPILTPADLKGLKFRVPNDKLAETAYKALGGNPVPMPFVEMFNALQQGVLDGADNPLVTMVTFKWYEVVKYMSLTNTAVGISPLIINEKKFQALPPDFQKLVLDAGKQSAKKNWEFEAELAGKSADILRKEGVRLDEPDLAPFRMKAAPAYDEAVKMFGADLMNKIKKSQADCE